MFSFLIYCPFLVCSLYSYLADQCWNGGCIYLIMLRRIKRKAPLPPCNGNTTVSGSGGTGSHAAEHRISSEPPGSPAQNGKRTRKFGVISRSSFTRDSKDSQDLELENGYHGSLSSVFIDTEVMPPEASSSNPSVDMPTEEVPVPVTTLPTMVIPYHLQNGGTATLPTRSHSRLSESCKTESLSSESSGQVRHSMLSWSRDGETLALASFCSALQMSDGVPHRCC